MRKSTVIIVLLTFALSVVIVGVFGMQMMAYNTRIYVKKITPTHVTTNTGATADIEQDEKDENLYQVILHYTEGLIVRIDYEIDPVDATDNTVKASITNNDEANPVGRLEGLTLHVLRVGRVRLNYRATDGNGTEITINVFILP